MANRYTVVKDKGYEAAIRNLRSFFDEDEVTVGIQSEQFNNSHPDSDYNIGQIAAVHEFGSKARTSNGQQRIPQRSFIRKSIDDPVANRAIVAMIVKEARAVSRGMRNAAQAMDRLGLLGVSIIQRYVQRGKVKPPLDPKTILKKGSSKPLIDTGRMIQSIRHKVRSKWDY